MLGEGKTVYESQAHFKNQLSLTKLLIVLSLKVNVIK